ncbi:MAG: CsbD family protein [Cyanophyceae cyanobacterium]
MISLQKCLNFFLTTILLLFVTIPSGAVQGFSASSISAMIHQPHLQMAFSNPFQGTAKDIEGKVQETYGNVTGDLGDQAIGKAKQLEGQAVNKANEMRVRNNLQDEMRDVS